MVIGTGGTISNSAAVDEDNDIYVATCQMLHKLVWTGSTLSQVAAGDAWCTAYPTINTYYTLFLSSSGSAPALMGFGRNNDAQ
ncbi:hypothetical protein [Paraburkholderia unamae]|uniref:hypothetical protein n=1 Tax=Paraburkholderia unamae TaxID=219649 RepID=UPI001C65BD43|nr:hypothetical protein [Paraburkholderia unamae]